MPQQSPSIQILLNAIKQAKLKKTEFARTAGLSYEYVSRVVNGKVKFPATRERLEQFASILDLDPNDFVEYREILKSSSPSLEAVWHRMRELGFSRAEVAEKVSFSRTYLYEILRGQIVFPKRKAILEDLAKALDLSPFCFEEYLLDFYGWAEEYPDMAEEAVLRLIANGYLKKLGISKEQAEKLLE